MRTAIGDLTPMVGVRAACEAFDFPRASFYDSSEKIVGGFRFGQLAKLVIQC